MGTADEGQQMVLPCLKGVSSLPYLDRKGAPYFVYIVEDLSTLPSSTSMSATTRDTGGILLSNSRLRGTCKSEGGPESHRLAHSF